MPRRSHSAIRVGAWYRCGRCGWDYRIADLRRQRGLLLCIFCWDNPIAWQRDQIIQDVLSAGAENEMAVDDALKEPTTEGDDINSDI
jgi:hypothetical protein